MTRRVHHLGIQPVDDLGVTGITDAFHGVRPSRHLLGPHSLPTFLPLRFRHTGGVRHVVHSVHNHYHHNHFHIYKEMGSPQALPICPHVITKERT